jgi:hypothetical protein
MLHEINITRGISMDLGGYFQILIGVMMTATFVTLALILLNAYYGSDEETEKQ